MVSELGVRRNEAVEGANILELHGEGLHLGSVFLDDHALSHSDFSVSKDLLWIPDTPDLSRSLHR